MGMAALLTQGMGMAALLTQGMAAPPDLGLVTLAEVRGLAVDRSAPCHVAYPPPCTLQNTTSSQSRLANKVVLFVLAAMLAAWIPSLLLRAASRQLFREAGPWALDTHAMMFPDGRRAN
jgi:hypothetical protein